MTRTLTMSLVVLALTLSAQALAGPPVRAKVVRSKPTPEETKALKLEGDVKRGEWAYAVCIGCHQANGAGTEDGLFPQLVGQHKSVLIKEIADIRGKVREAPVMHPLAKTITDPQELADTVAYILTLPVPHTNGTGPGIDLANGKALYEKDCKSCHGEQGEGDGASFYPAVAGQHYKYLLKQAQTIRDGGRKNANKDMVKVIKGYSDKDIDAVVDYLSRLKLGAPAKAAPETKPTKG